MVTIPDCLLVPKRATDKREEKPLASSLPVSSPRQTYKAHFDQGWLVDTDFPDNKIPEGVPTRFEEYRECRFLKDAARPVVEFPSGCALYELVYVCEMRTRLIWLHPVREVVLYDSKDSQSVKVAKSVLLCNDGGATVLRVTKRRKDSSYGGDYDASRDLKAGEECPPCDCAQYREWSVPFDAPMELDVQETLDTEQPGGGRVRLRERYWRLVPPRRRIAQCLEQNSYKLMERIVEVGVGGVKTVVGEEKDVAPSQTHEFLFTIPNCPPPAPGSEAGRGER